MTCGILGFWGKTGWIVCKRVDSVYEPGRRSLRGSETPLRHTTESVVVGGCWDQAPTRNGSGRWFWVCT